MEQEWLESYRWVTGGAEIYTLPESDSHGNVTVELRKKQCRWELISDNPLKIKATLQGTLLITENSAGAEQRTMAERDIFQTQIQQEVHKLQIAQVKRDFSRMQDVQCDVFRLGRWLHAWYPRLVHSEGWPYQFGTIEIEIDMETSIESEV
jgi:hypothetical protein